MRSSLYNTVDEFKMGNRYYRKVLDGSNRII